MEKYDGAIRIGVIVDDKNAEQDIKEINNSVADVSDSFKKAEKAGLSFGDVLKANVLSDAIVSGIGKLKNALGSFVSGSVTAAADLRAEVSQYEQAFGQMEDTATSTIKSIASETGILETRLRGAATSVYSFARASGGTEIESLSLMEGALAAAADAAAYYDRSLDDTTATLMSFLKGNFENDAALGLSATETTRNAAAMELFGKKFMDLSEIQKQQTLLKMVTDAQALSGAMGQAARESGGLENVMGNLNEVGEQIQGNIGAPVLEAIIPAIQEITAELMKWSEGVDWSAFGSAVGGFITGIFENGPAILSLVSGIGAAFAAWNVVAMINGVVKAINAFRAANEGATIAQAALNLALNANPIGIIVTAIAGLVAAILVLWNTNEDFRNAVIGIFNKIATAFKTIVNGIIDGINWLITQLNKVHFEIPTWVPAIGGKKFGFDIQKLPKFNIPALAQGTVVPPNREFMALLGDNKRETEVVSPLSTMKQAFKEALLESGGSGGEIRVELLLDGRKLAENQIKHINSLSRSLGGGSIHFG